MSRGPRWLLVLAAVVLTSTSRAGPDRGAPPATQRKSTDTVLFNALRDVINRGAKLYNAGDPAACYRLYEGSLRTIRPLLEHHEKLPRLIDNALASAGEDPYVWRRAFTLRRALDKVRDRLNPSPKLEQLPKLEKLPLPQVEE
jgi:hypothetical protein